MKKILAIFSAFLLVLGLASCDQNTSKTSQASSTVQSQSSTTKQESSSTAKSSTQSSTQSSSSSDNFVLTFELSKTELTVDWSETVKLSDYVTCKGSDMVSYAGFVTYTSETGKILNNVYLDTQTAGTFVVKANIKISKHNIDETRTITVTVREKVEIGTNMITSPVVNEDMTNYDLFAGDGGSAEVSTEDIDGATYNKVHIISATGNGPYSPRLRTNGENLVTVEEGQKYIIRFQAKASIASRKMNFQVGQILDGAPYFYSATGYAKVFTLTNSMQYYQFTFVATKIADAQDLAQTSILFELGTVGGDSNACDVWLGNLEMGTFSGEVPDVMEPTIEESAINLFVGDEAPVVADLAVAKDIIDPNPTITYVLKDADGNEVTAIDTTKAGKYTLEVTATDAAGNEATGTRVITVVEQVTGNVFVPVGVIDGVKEDAPANQNTFVYWTNTDGGVTTAASFADGALTMVNSADAATDFWSIQVFYATSPVSEDGTYNLSFTVNSPVAGQFTYEVLKNKTIVDLVEGDNQITYTTNSLVKGTVVTIDFFFGGSDTNTHLPSGTFVFSDFSLEKAATPEEETPVVVIPDVDMTMVTLDKFLSGGEAASAADPGTLSHWYVEDAAWNCGPVVVSDTTVVDNGVQVVNDFKDNTNAWAAQMFYTFEAVEAGQYVFELNVNSSVEGTFTVKLNGAVNEVKLVAGDNKIRLLFTLEETKNVTMVFLFGTQPTTGDENVPTGTFVFQSLGLGKVVE